MKAVAMRDYGPVEVLEVVDLPKPVPGSGEVLVEVRASSVNPIDWKIRQGKARAILPRPGNGVLGFDVAGVVVEVGDGVTRFRLGDRIFGAPNVRRRGPMRSSHWWLPMSWPKCPHLLTLPRLLRSPWWV